MKKLAIMIMSALLLAALAGPAWADYQAGLEAYNKHDYTQALKHLRPMAEKGHAKAQSMLGWMYYAGEGVVTSPQKTVPAINREIRHNDLLQEEVFCCSEIEVHR